MNRFLRLAVLILPLLGVAATSAAQERIGRVTELALPRFVSIKSTKANARRGPGLDQKIDWVFMRRNLPVRVVDEYNHWRRVEDSDGRGGWVHYSLLSGRRTVLVTQSALPIRAKPAADARVLAQAETGVVGLLSTCTTDWCEVEMGAFDGWVPKSGIWGVDP